MPKTRSVLPLLAALAALPSGFAAADPLIEPVGFDEPNLHELALGEQERPAAAFSETVGLVAWRPAGESIRLARVTADGSALDPFPDGAGYPYDDHMQAHALAPLPGDRFLLATRHAGELPSVFDLDGTDPSLPAGDRWFGEEANVASGEVAISAGASGHVVAWGSNGAFARILNEDDDAPILALGAGAATLIEAASAGPDRHLVLWRGDNARSLRVAVVDTSPGADPVPQFNQILGAGAGEVGRIDLSCAAGSCAIAYERTDNGRQAFVRRLNPDTLVAGPERRLPGVDERGYGTQVAQNADGSVFVTWTGGDVHGPNGDARFRLYTRHVTPAELGINGALAGSTSVGDAPEVDCTSSDDHNLVSLPGGGALIAWATHERGQCEQAAYARTVTALPGGGIDKGVRNTYSRVFYEEAAPRIATNDLGHMLMVWQSSDGEPEAERDIEAALFDVTVPSAPALLDRVTIAGGATDQAMPDVASDGVGFAVSWKGPAPEVGAGWGRAYVRLAAVGPDDQLALGFARQLPMPFPTVHLGTGLVHLAANPLGWMAVLRHENQGVGAVPLNLAGFPVPDAFFDPTAGNGLGGGWNSGARVAPLEDGFALAWSKRVDDVRHTLVRRIDANGNLGPVFLLGTSELDSNEVGVAASDDGTVLVSWAASSPAGAAVYGVRLDLAAGVRIDDEPLVISDGPDPKSAVSVVSSGSDFLVGWLSDQNENYAHAFSRIVTAAGDVAGECDPWKPGYEGYCDSPGTWNGEVQGSQAYTPRRLALAHIPTVAPCVEGASFVVLQDHRLGPDPLMSPRMFLRRPDQFELTLINWGSQDLLDLGAGPIECIVGGGDPAEYPVCDVPMSSPGCADDATCEQTICDADSYCCDYAWDWICADHAITWAADSCGGGASETTSGSACTDAVYTPGCSESTTCEQTICAADSFCCDVMWDGLCADAAAVSTACEL